MNGSGSVAVVDYGAGNLLSVVRALRHCGAEVLVTSDIQQLQDADRIVVPGVGAFGKCMDALTERGLVEPLRHIALAGEKPFLGICVGMQMLLDESFEFGRRAGLGIIPGAVRSVPDHGPDGQALKIPHMGWNRLSPPEPGRWAGTMMDATQEGAYVYFVHSFAACPQHDTDILATTEYGGNKVVAAVQRGSVMGVQFHPEKSGEIGLAMLKAFLCL